MGLSVVDPGGSGSLPIYVDLGIGPGDVFIATILLYLLGYLYLLDPTDIARSRKRDLRVALLASVVPLLLSFAAVLLYSALTLV